MVTTDERPDHQVADPDRTAQSRSRSGRQGRRNVWGNSPVFGHG
jgi:hypothetical protein